jgi:hypothetical protein
MWQIICLCLPAMTRSEQQRIFALFSEVLRACGRKPGEIDIGLFFLHSLSPEETLTVLEERLALVARSQELMELPREKEAVQDHKQRMINDHIQTLLAAERDWLKRTITQLQIMNTHQDIHVAEAG